MKLKDIYLSAIRYGMAKDPRPEKDLVKMLKDAKRAYSKTKGADRRAFDKERFINPYADTRILYGDPDIEVKKVMIGIDMEMPELLTAHRLNEMGEEIDLVIAHHPEGVAWSCLPDVMHLQVALLKKFGLADKVAEDFMKERIGEVQRGVAPSNHARSVDIARLLDIPFMCMHTPADNNVAHYLQHIFDTKAPARLSDVITLLKAMPEYEAGMFLNAGPKILVGEPKAKAGKVFVDMTGGTEGSRKIYSRLSQAGVGTVVGMHFSEDHFRAAKGEHINVVIAGHIASDVLGMNLILDRIDCRGQLEIVECSGFKRVRR